MKKEKYSHKDFTLSSLKINAIDRIFEFQKYIDQLRDNDHEIYWIESKGPVKPAMEIANKNKHGSSEVISFVSNDYLGMSQRKDVIQAGIDGLVKYGTGVCAAPCIGGYLDIHRTLEFEIAAFTGQEDAMLFSSGFGANSGTISALLGNEDIAIVDTGVHTSVYDGLRSTNTKLIPHNNLEYLELVLKRVEDRYKTKMVIIDGVYSQDGDLGLVKETSILCKKFNALLLVDDAHGIGVFGNNGRGVLEYNNMLGEVDLITGTFSKAFGAVGGFVAASKQMIQYLRYYANTSIFSAAIIPQVTCSVLKALDLIKNKPDIRKTLWENADYLKKGLVNEGFDIGNSNSPITPLMIRDDFKVKEVVRLLRDDGIYAIGIVYPAVRNKEARVRITTLATHNKAQIDRLLDSLRKIDKKLVLK